MVDSTSTSASNAAVLPAAAHGAATTGDVRTPKKRQKVRSAWISFVGRIVAQFVGSAATIALGIVVLQQYQTAPKHERAGSAVQGTSVRRVEWQPARTEQDSAIAVLPLLSFSQDSSQQYLADSLTDTLRADLAQLPELHVVSGTSAKSLGHEPHHVTEIAEALGVRYVVEGSVVQANGRLRVTAELIDARRDEHVWARRYDREAGDALTAQSEISAEIVQELHRALVKEQGGPVSTVGALNPGAHRAH